MSDVISIFVATLLGFTILEPVHLLWINLVTDCFPALALGMEKTEPDIMQRKPRSAKAGVFAGGMSFDVAYQGLLIAAFGTLIATTLVCEVEVLAKTFEFEAVSLEEYLVAIGLGVLVIPIVEIVKFIQRKAAKN